MNIKHLHKSISELSDKEAISLIRHLRDLRRQLPETKRVIKKKKKEKTSAKSIEISFLDMTDIEKAELLKKFLRLKKGAKNG